MIKNSTPTPNWDSQICSGEFRCDAAWLSASRFRTGSCIFHSAQLVHNMFSSFLLFEPMFLLVVRSGSMKCLNGHLMGQ